MIRFPGDRGGRRANVVARFADDGHPVRHRARAIRCQGHTASLETDLETALDAAAAPGRARDPAISAGLRGSAAKLAQAPGKCLEKRQKGF